MSCCVRVTDRAAIEAYYRAAGAAAHAYELGDLDDFFWPHTAWYALAGGGEAPQHFRAMALLYTATDLPILLATTEREREADTRTLLAALGPEALPRYVYAHLNPRVAYALRPWYRRTSHGVHYKMALTLPERLEAVGCGETVRLTPDDADEVEAFYRAAYPEGWIDLETLRTGQYVGVRDGRTGALGCVAGVHVYAPRQRVATLGNVATLPEARGKGFATRACAALCRNLRAAGVEHVSLNVRTDNAPALRAYEKIGFTRLALYEEFMLTKREVRG